MSVSRSKRASFAPRLETLEDRCTPAASITPNGSTLAIVSGNLADTVEITIDDAANRVTVRTSDALGSNERVVAADSVTGITFVGGGGNDQVTCRLASDLSRARSVVLSLGAGNDSAQLDFGEFKSHALSADLSLTVFGRSGSDSVRADFGNVNASNLT